MRRDDFEGWRGWLWIAVWFLDQFDQRLDLQSAHRLFHVTLRITDFEGCLSRRLLALTIVVVD
jgi:hypothetical protein